MKKTSQNSSCLLLIVFLGVRHFMPLSRLITMVHMHNQIQPWVVQRQNIEQSALLSSALQTSFFFNWSIRLKELEVLQAKLINSWHRAKSAHFVFTFYSSIFNFFFFEFPYLDFSVYLLLKFISDYSWLFLQFEAKICLVTSFRDTCYIEILPTNKSPTRGKYC